MPTIRRIVHPLEPVHFNEQNCHLLLRLRLQQRNLRFVLDTGATASVLNHTFASKWTTTPCQAQAIGFNGTLSDLSTIKMHDMRIGRYKLPEITFIVTPMDGIVRLYKTEVRRSIVGLIGSNDLLLWGAVIDYTAMTITLHL